MVCEFVRARAFCEERNMRVPKSPFEQLSSLLLAVQFQTKRDQTEEKAGKRRTIFVHDIAGVYIMQNTIVGKIEGLRLLLLLEKKKEKIRCRGREQGENSINTGKCLIFCDF